MSGGSTPSGHAIPVQKRDLLRTTLEVLFPTILPGAAGPPSRHAEGPSMVTVPRRLSDDVRPGRGAILPPAGGLP